MDSQPPAVHIPVDTTDHINAVVLPTCALIAIFLTYLPFKSFYRNQNFPAANIVVLVTLQNIFVFVNAIIWSDGDWTTWWNGVGLCDVQGVLTIPTTTAVASSFAAFTRTLSNAIDVDSHSFVDTPAARKRALVVDILICWSVPVLQMALNYVVQLCRFIIAPVYGCAVEYDKSWLTIVIMYLWAPLFSMFAAYRACLIIYRLRKHRAHLSRVLSTSNSGYTTRRYLKLLLLSLCLVVVVVPVQIFYLTINLPAETVPYSWTRVHDPAVWSTVIYLSTADFPMLQYNGWISIAVSFLVYSFFGFNDDAVDHYRRWMVAVGLGKIWPSLKESRASRISRRRGSGSRSSWRDQLNLVSRTTKYFDGTKKSQATTLTSSQSETSRKDSQATSSTFALTVVASNTSSAVAAPSSTIRSFHDVANLDNIAPAPSQFNTSILPSIPEPSILVTPSARGNSVFSTWRTNLQLPFPFFSPRKHKPAMQTQSEQHAPSSNQDMSLDLEVQRPPRSSSLAEITHQQPTISTTIWSDPFTSISENKLTNTKVTTQTQTHTSNPSISTIRSNDMTDSVDLLSPKLGSRAYRERERREMEREQAELRAARMDKSKIYKLVNSTSRAL